MHRANKVYEEDLHSYQHTISQLNADSWYHCILDARELPAERIDAALKHLIVYSPKAVVLGGTAEQTTTIGGATVPSDTTWWPEDPGYQRIKQRADEVGIDRVYFLPQSVRESVSDYSESEYWDAQYEGGHYDFYSDYKNPNGQPLSVCDPQIDVQLSSARTRREVLDVFLPDLVGVPLERVVQIRGDHQGTFENFHAALKKILFRTATLESTERARELLQEVHHGVRTFDAQMRDVKRRSAFKVGEVAFGAACIGLTFALPSEAAQLLVSAIGAFKAKDFVSDILRVREEKDRLTRSDFYGPWLLSQEAKRK